MNTFFLCLIIAAIFVVSPTNACSCMLPTVKSVCNEAFNFAAKVKVLDVGLEGNPSGQVIRRNKLEVKELYKGEGVRNGGKYWLKTPAYDSLCGLYLEVDEEYYMIGKFNNNGEIEADLCNWKKRAEDIEDDDLDFLENEQLYCQL